MAQGKSQRSLRGLIQLSYWRNRQRTPFQDGDHSWNDPRVFPGSLRQRSGMFLELFGECPYPWFQKKFVQFGQSTQDAGLCPAEVVGQFLSDSALIFFRSLCYILLGNFGCDL